MNNIPLEYGQIVEIAKNTLVIGGRHPSSILFEEDIPKIVLYKSNDTLYLMDTGVGEKFRKAILKASGRLRPFKKLIIFNSHYHPDHTFNNGIINDIEAKEKHLYAPALTIQKLDSLPIFEEFYKKYARNFIMFEGLLFDSEIIKKFLSKQFDKNIQDQQLSEINKLGIQLNFSKLFNSFIPQFMREYSLNNFVPYNPSVNSTAISFERKPISSFTIGGSTWKGWNFSDDVYVLEAHGHSPEGVIFYFPKTHYLHVSDETSSIPIWPDTNVKNALEVLKKYQMLTDNHTIEIFSNGHHPFIYVGKENITAFIRILLDTHDDFIKIINDALAKENNGLTIDELYTSFTSSTLISIKYLVTFQFPRYATFIKGYILNELQNDNYRSEGEGHNKKYFYKK